MLDQAHIETDRELEKLERKLRTLYGKAATQSQKKANQFFQKFAQLDAMKKKQVDNGELDKSTYLEWRKNKMAMGENYRAMVDTLTTDLVNADKIAAGIINGHLPDVYANNYNFGTYQIEHDTRIDTSFTLYDRQTVERLVQQNPDVIPIKAKPDIPKDRLWNKQKINSVITQSILTGDSIPDIARSLRKVAEMDKTAALRTARTATTSAENGGRIDSYQRAQDMGINLKQQWVATLDGRTRDSHRSLDGKTVPVAKDKWHPSKFPNGCRFPGDPQGPGHEIYNCRCTLIGVVDGVDFELSDITKRDNKLGDMTYDEWKANKRKVRAEQKPVGKPKRTIALGQTASGYSEESVRRITEMLQNADEKVQAVWSKFEPQLASPISSKKQTPHYDPIKEKVTLNIERTEQGDSIHPPFQTHFHEYGHNIDYLASDDNTNMTAFSSQWTDEKGRTLKDIAMDEWYAKFSPSYGMSDVEVISRLFSYQEGEGGMGLESYAYSELGNWRRTFGISRNDGTYKSLKAEIEGLQTKEDYVQFALRNPGVFNIDIEKQRNRFIKSDVDKDQVNTYIEKMKDKYSLRARGDLSDMMEPFTCDTLSKDYPLDVGHGKRYATHSGNTNTEIFTEMFSSEISNLESLELIKQELPETYKAFRKILEVMI